MNNQLSSKLNQKLNSLVDSYKTLKMILIPNLSEDKNFFMKSFLDIILFQIQLFIRIVTIKEQKKAFDLLNYNNQVLSQKITAFYDHFNSSKSDNKETDPMKISENYKKFLEFDLNDKIIINDNFNKINVKSPEIKKHKSMGYIKIKETAKKKENNNNYNISKHNDDYNTDDNNLWQCTTTRNNKKDNFISSDKNNKKIKNINIRNYLKTKENLQNNQASMSDNDFMNFTTIGYRESKILEDDNEKTLTQTNNNAPNKDYFISICATNRLIDRLNKKSISKKTSPNNKSNNNIKTNNNISDRLLSNTISRNNKSKNNINNFNGFGSYFSIDEFLIPCNSKNTKKNNNEKLYLTKEGNILLNDHQKDLIEKYVNKCVLNESINLLSNNISNNKIKPIKNSFVNENITEDDKEVLELLNTLPTSFKKPIDYFITKKRTLFLNSGIFKACHKAIDNYKELEGKEKIFSKKISRNKSNVGKLITTAKSTTNVKQKNKKFFDTETNDNININQTVIKN